MINVRTDLGITPALDLRPMQRSVPAIPVMAPPAADRVDLRARPAAPDISGPIAPQPVVNPFEKALNLTSDRAVRDASIHGAADPQQYLMAGAANSGQALDGHTRKHFPGMALLVGVVMAAGIMTVPIACSHAGEVTPPQTTVSQTADAGVTDQMQRVGNLANSLGISPTVLSGVGDAKVTTALEKLRPDVREMYKTLAPQHKKLMAEKLRGTSGFLFIRVSNRDAFIKGEAGGVNAFDHMQDTLKETVTEGKLDPATATKLSGAIETFRGMTPDQRAAVVKVLEADVATLR